MFCEDVCVWIFLVTYVLYVSNFKFVVCMQGLLFTFHIVIDALPNSLRDPKVGPIMKQ